MFSKMMAVMAGKAGFPNGLMGDEEDLEKTLDPSSVVRPGEMQLGRSPNSSVLDPSSVVRPGEMMSVGDLVGQRMEGLREIASDPGAYAMGRIGGAVDRVTSLAQDPVAYAEQRFRMALDGTLDEEERAAAKSRARMQQFQSQAMQDYQAGQRATQLPTGYFNSAQRGLM